VKTLFQQQETRGVVFRAQKHFRSAQAEFQSTPRLAKACPFEVGRVGSARQLSGRQGALQYLPEAEELSAFEEGSLPEQDRWQSAQADGF